uniref:Uncharacterized protein n=1 Tax=Anopheles atroparvus TaxID=41427 RepID=A0A182JJJ8_ANOAO
MSGVGFLATMKTFAPSIRRRRRIEKQNLELHNNHNNNNHNTSSNSGGSGGGSGGSTPGSAGTPATGGGGGGGGGGVSSTASTPTGPSAASGILGGVGEVISPGWDIVPPITPPAAFLPPGYKRLSMKGKVNRSKGSKGARLTDECRKENVELTAGLRNGSHTPRLNLLAARTPLAPTCTEPLPPTLPTAPDKLLAKLLAPLRNEPAAFPRRLAAPFTTEPAVCTTLPAVLMVALARLPRTLLAALNTLATSVPLPPLGLLRAPPTFAFTPTPPTLNPPAKEPPSSGAFVVVVVVAEVVVVVDVGFTVVVVVDAVVEAAVVVLVVVVVEAAVVVLVDVVVGAAVVVLVDVVVGAAVVVLVDVVVGAAVVVLVVGVLDVGDALLAVVVGAAVVIVEVVPEVLEEAVADAVDGVAADEVVVVDAIVVVEPVVRSVVMSDSNPGVLLGTTTENPLLAVSVHRPVLASTLIDNVCADANPTNSPVNSRTASPQQTRHIFPNGACILWITRNVPDFAGDNPALLGQRQTGH